MSFLSLQERFPTLKDRSFVDVFNSLYVNDGLLRYRQSRGAIVTVLDKLTLLDTKQSDLVETNNLQILSGLTNWLSTIEQDFSISRKALLIAQNKYFELKKTVMESQRVNDEIRLMVQNLESKLYTHHRELEMRVASLEIQQKAATEFEAFMQGWKAQRIYNNCPWLLQICLLSLDIFGGAVGEYEAQNGDLSYRRMLGDLIASNVINLPLTYQLSFPKSVANLQGFVTRSEIEAIASLFYTDCVSIDNFKLCPHIYMIAIQMNNFVEALHEDKSVSQLKAFQTVKEQIRGSETMVRIIELKKLINIIVVEAAEFSLNINKKDSVR